MENSMIFGTENTRNAVFPQYQRKGNGAGFQKGQIVNGEIIKINAGKTTLRVAEDTLLEFPQDQVAGRVGERVRFEVVKAGAGGIALKQLGSTYEQTEKELIKQLNIHDLKDLMQTSGFVPEDENLMAPKTMQELQKETDAKMAEAVKRIKRQLSYASGNATAAAIAELVKSGISLEKISIRIVNTVIQDVAETQTAQPQGHKAQYRQGLQGQATSYQAEAEIANKLKETGGLSEAAIAELVKNGKPLTLENTYIAKYSAAGSEPALREDTIAQLMPEIERILIRDGVAVNPDTVEAAKLLARYEIPINPGNIEKVDLLRHMEERMDESAVVSQAMALLAMGENPMDLDLTGVSLRQDGDTAVSAARTEALAGVLAETNILPQHIDLYYKQHDVVTLARLLDFVRQNPFKGQDAYAAEPVIPPSARARQAQRQIAEIQLRLTSQAAQRLAGKGVEIDMMPLQEALEQLRVLERESFAAVLTASEGEASSQNIGRMTDLFAHMQRLCPVSHQAVRGIGNGEIPFTIEGVAGANQRAAAQYGRQAAEPNARYGDGIAKIAEQFGPVLQSLGYEPTPESIRALEILTRNNMELNEENLTRIKLIDGKIHDIVQRLNPWIAADMIRNGLNPAKMDIDQVLQYINQYEEAFGENSIDRIAKAIQEMDDQQLLSKDERKSVIAIYRMLNHIQKDGAAAAGLVYQSGHSLTLGNLLEAAQYRRKAKPFDQAVSNGEGLAERTGQEQDQEQGQRITDILEKTSREQYQDFTIRRFIRAADSSVLAQWIGETPGYADIPLETAAAQLQAIRVQRTGESILDAHTAEAYQSRLNAMNEVPAGTVRWMQENNVPVTLTHVEAAQAYLQESHGMAKALSRLREAVIAEKKETGKADTYPAIDLDAVLPDSTLAPLEQDGAISAVIGQIQEQLDAMLSKTEEVAPKAIEPIQAARSAMALLRASNGPIQRMPVLFNQQIAELSLYVVNENLDDTGEARVWMSLNAGGLGTVDIMLETQGNQAAVTVSADSRAGLSALKENQEHLIALIEEAGFVPAGISFAEDSASPDAAPETRTSHSPAIGEDIRFERIV